MLEFLSLSHLSQKCSYTLFFSDEKTLDGMSLRSWMLQTGFLVLVSAAMSSSQNIKSISSFVASLSKNITGAMHLQSLYLPYLYKRFVVLV